MKDFQAADLYQGIGNLIKQHRERLGDMTQEKLARVIGLSRTSVTNIEKGRQQVSLHHLFAIAEALSVRPEVLLPSLQVNELAPGARKLPAGIDKDISGWATKVVRSKP